MNATTIWPLARASTPRLRSWLPAVLLMAICAGIVMAAAAGARRTDTAYSRFLASTTSPDLVIPYANATPQDPTAEKPTMERISRLPQVSAFSKAYAPAMEGQTDTGRQITSQTSIQPVALEDDSPQPKVAGFKVLDGRLFDPHRADEAVAGLSAAQLVGLHPGSTLHLRFAVQPGPGGGGSAGGRGSGGPPASGGAPGPAGGGAPASGGPPPGPVHFNTLPPGEPAGPEMTIHVVGVVVSSGPGDFGVSASRQATVYLTSAFARRYADRFANVALVVQLKRGAADLAAFKSNAEKVARGGIFYFSLSDSRAATQSSIHLQAVALALFAALGALVCLLVAGQAVARQVLAGGSDSAVLRSLGVAPPQLWLAGMLPAGLAGLAAALLAVPLAVVLSPLTPLGVARVADPAPGIAVDLPVLGLGVLAIVAATLLVAGLPAWRASCVALHASAGAARRSGTIAAVDALSRSGLPASVSSGIRLALAPGAARSRAPVLAALTGCAIGVAAIAAALTFRASLDHLLSTPRLYGWGWGAEVSPNSGPDPTTPVPSGPEILGVAGGASRELSIDGERVGAVGIDQLHGRVEPVITEGRMPANDGEILLGTSTGTGHRLGDPVQVGVGGSSRRMTVVGRGLIPAATGTARLGSGAFLTFGGIRSVLGAAAAPAYDLFPVVLAPGTDLARETRAWEARYGGPGSVNLPSPPRSLADFGDVDQLPGILAAVLVLAGVGALAHALVTAARRRRRDLAILKTLGFTQRQVVATVLWQSVTLAAVAAVIGLPLGIAAGRWAWSLFATTQGTLVETVVPLTVSLLVAPLAVVAAVVVGLMPGWIAATVRPAVVLRSE